MEYTAEASDSPIVCIRKGKYKYIACMSHSSQLFDLEVDPKELNNLVDKVEHKAAGKFMGAPTNMRPNVQR